MALVHVLLVHVSSKQDMFDKADSCSSVEDF